MRHLAILLLVSFAVAACASPPVPRDHFYRVRVAPLVGNARPMAFPGIVSVTAFEADGLLRERPILFSSAATDNEMQQHDYHYWNAAPTRLLQQSLAVYLQQSGLADTVVTPGMRIRPDFEIVGKVRRFERLVHEDSQKVVAELELAVVQPDDQGLVLLKTYRVERQAEDRSVGAAVAALENALAEIFGSFTADVTAVNRSRNS
ncbi:MAG: ABC-type transport auxiliary lipoprotein family protein [Alphaproteobacteria bacterium]